MNDRKIMVEVTEEELQKLKEGFKERSVNDFSKSELLAALISDTPCEKEERFDARSGKHFDVQTHKFEINGDEITISIVINHNKNLFGEN